MTHHHRPTRHILLILVCCLWGAVTVPVGAAEEPLTLREWARAVWESANQGDLGALEGYLSKIPDPPGNEQARRLRAALDQHNDNLQIALANRTEARDDARRRMQEELAAGELSQALTAAVEVQTLSDDLEAVLDEPEIAEVVAKARAEIPPARREGDWLYAYELLYRLDVLYEHSDEYQDELDRVNQRLALLTHYAPRRLHELRQRQAERFGEEPLGEFNATLAEDWKERVDDITDRMVRRALETAAEHHIEGEGWRPLLRGGLEGLRTLATTPALAETFTTLRDAEKVNYWLDYIDEELDRLDRTPDGDLGYWKCSRMLDALADESKDTIGLPELVIYREFADGAMRELDEFSEIIWPNKLRRFRQSTHGSFVGVGILIRHDEKREIMVVSPLEGTPAYFSGVKPGDRITRVDGVSTAGWSLNDAVDKITGRRGTEVELDLRREDVDEPVHLTIVRDVIKIRSVKGWWKKGLDAEGEPQWEWFIDPDTRIAYIRLTAFNEDTHEDLKRAWKEINAVGHPNGVILDLRFNPGGLLTSAVDISNLFVREGVIVSGETKDGGRAWPDRRADRHKALIAREGVPTVVLINQGSASASEIVAGCLQAHRASVIVGRRSFGKGSVQTVHPISRSTALLKLTTQYYRLPPNQDQRAMGEKGDLVHKRPGAQDWGVDPDVAVNTTPRQIKAAYDLRQAADIISRDDAEAAERPDINDLLTQGLDPQLETALLILQAKALETTAGDTRHAMAE
ncbi:MAG: S41 family peptidase [Planctomycetota bacterium]